MIFVTKSLSKRSVFTMFFVHTEKRSRGFQIPPVFEKLCFRDGIVLVVGLTVEIKLRFQISPAKCRRCAGMETSEKTLTYLLQTWILLTKSSASYIPSPCITYQHYMLA